MPVTAFNNVTWGEEDVTAAKLNSMAQNSLWLYENLPKAHLLTYGGIRKDEKVKIAAGVITIPKSKEKIQQLKVDFDSFFTKNCKPIIVCTIVSHQNSKYVVTTYGIRGQGYVPLDDGFMARVAVFETNANVNFFNKTSYLNWIAMGY